MKRFFFPVWCKGSIGDSRSPDAGSSPAAGSIDPHDHARHTPRIAVLTATLGLLATLLATTSPTVLAEGLPDGRVFEMVTPPSNYDADAYVPLGLPQEFVENAGEFGTRLPFQVAADGTKIEYVASPTVGGTGNSGFGKGNEYLSRWTEENGWGKPINLQPLGEKGAVANSAFYQAFSPDLSLGILQSGSYEELAAPLLSPQAPGGGYAVLYAHTLESAAYQPFFRTAPSNLPASEFQTPRMPTIGVIASNRLAYAGASSNYSRLFFEGNGKFEDTGALSGGVEENNLYESEGGSLSLVNVLPDGTTEPNATFGAEPLNTGSFSPADFSNVISEDGSRVFWTALEPNFQPKALYVRKNPTQPESPLGPKDECLNPADACTLAVSQGPAHYWTASKDGKYAFYTEGEGEASELYRFDVEGGPTGTREVLTALKAGVEGVLGEGEESDGKYTIYFVAKGVLSENKNSNGVEAEPEKDNLYMLREGAKPVFIAVLAPRDQFRAIQPLYRKIGEVGDWTPGLGSRTAEVTPNGRSLVFMSKNQSFNGHYEEAGGNVLEEVYVFDGEAGASGSLFCASCARDGLKAQENLESEEELGAYLPVSSSLTSQQTLISEDGSKVFFDSDQPLLLADTNGEQDVYEWEREGSGSCKESGGCVYLLSGGAGTTSSWLIGSDATGENVFLVTRAQLAPQDENENYDLYDARVNGIQPVLPAACSGTGCQGVPAQAPTFATPSSVTFAGVGNFAPPAEPAAPAKPKAKTKPLTRAQKLTRALAACRVEHPKRARVACERAARQKYAALNGAKRGRS